MVSAVQAGESLRAVARTFRVSLHTVQRWVTRAGRRRLDRVDWADQPPVAHRVYRTPPEVEDQVLRLRRELRETSALGEYGARAIHREWPAATGGPPPVVRTVGRILERRGALDGQRRIRRPAPPRGWYLPPVARDGGAATFVTLRAVGSALREPLGPVVARSTALGRIAGTPRGTDRSHAVRWARSSARPRGTEPPIGGDLFPPWHMARADAGTTEPRWPGGPW